MGPRWGGILPPRYNVKRGVISRCGSRGSRNQGHYTITSKQLVAQEGLASARPVLVSEAEMCGILKVHILGIPPKILYDASA